MFCYDDDFITPEGRGEQYKNTQIYKKIKARSVQQPNSPHSSYNATGNSGLILTNAKRQ